MTQIITITSLPPQVKQFYDSILLSKPTSKFYDDSELLWRVYTYIKLKLSKKSKYHPNSEIKYNQLEKEFLELYERAKTKEKDYERETGNQGQKFFYYIIITDRSHSKIFERLRSRSYSVYMHSKKSYEI